MTSARAPRRRHDRGRQPASRQQEARRGKRLLNQGRASPLCSRVKRPKDGVSSRLNYKAQLVSCALSCVLRRAEPWERNLQPVYIALRFVRSKRNSAALLVANANCLIDLVEEDFPISDFSG